MSESFVFTRAVVDLILSGRLRLEPFELPISVVLIGPSSTAPAQRGARRFSEINRIADRTGSVRLTNMSLIVDKGQDVARITADNVHFKLLGRQYAGMLFYTPAPHGVRDCVPIGVLGQGFPISGDASGENVLNMHWQAGGVLQLPLVLFHLRELVATTPDMAAGS